MYMWYCICGWLTFGFPHITPCDHLCDVGLTWWETSRATRSKSQNRFYFLEYGWEAAQVRFVCRMNKNRMKNSHEISPVCSRLNTFTISYLTRIPWVTLVLLGDEDREYARASTVGQTKTWLYRYFIMCKHRSKSKCHKFRMSPPVLRGDEIDVLFSDKMDRALVSIMGSIYCLSQNVCE